MLPVVQNNMMRSAIPREQMRWPDGCVPYVIAPVFNKKERIIIGKAMQDYHNKTCIE